MGSVTVIGQAQFLRKILGLASRFKRKIGWAVDKPACTGASREARENDVLETVRAVIAVGALGAGALVIPR